MFLAIGRTSKEAVQNFFRNGWLSIATVSIMILFLYVLSVFVVIGFSANNILRNVEDKVNITIYFKPEVDENAILDIKSNLEGFNEVKSVDYISKNQALDDFKANNSDDPIILQSLDEIGSNPLLASLVVKANNPNQYQLIADYVGKAYFSDEVSRVNYGKNKEVIDKLNSIIATIRRIGISLGLFFGLVSLLISFNAIRITIYTHRQEVEIMRLVGASNTYIRLPFIFEGVIYGIVSAFISMLILFISVKFVTPYISTTVPSANLASFYWGNFGWLLFGQVIFGSLLGVVGSLIAMRKYLQV